MFTFARLTRTFFKGHKRAESSGEDDIELQTNNISDEERVYHTVERYPRGYPQLAALQSSDSVFSMFRKFGLLHTRCLLLQQDELCSLEKQLEEVDQAERTQLYLSSRLYDENPDRQSVLDQIRCKLRQYDDDLLRFFRLSECNVPTRDNVESFTRWMHAVKPLIEPETRFSRYVDDLVTVNRDVEEGILEEIIEKFARRYGIGNGFLKTEVERRKTLDPDLHFYSVKRRQIVVRLLLTGVASGLLLLPTLLLFVLQNTAVRLVVISFFTLMFAFGIALLTRAKRHEIFAATATFTAVLVVFVSNIP